MLFTRFGFLTKHFEDDDMLNITNILLRNLEYVLVTVQCVSNIFFGKSRLFFVKHVSMVQCVGNMRFHSCGVLPRHKIKR